jgi:hypothetical protein
MNTANNQRLVIHLRTRLSSISKRCSQIVAQLSDEEILDRYADHRQQQKDQAERKAVPVPVVIR